MTNISHRSVPLLLSFVLVLVTTSGNINTAVALRDNKGYGSFHGWTSAEAAVPRAAVSISGGASTNGDGDPYEYGQRGGPSALWASHRRLERRLDHVAFASAANILINVLRPDEWLTWQMRMPRVCWEACIRVVARSARERPANVLLLGLMLGVTATVDIFVWGPVFGWTVSFETCSGGGFFSGKQSRVCVSDYSKGFSGLLATFQSIFGGLFYLASAVDFWSGYWDIRAECKVQRQMAALAEVLDSPQQRIAGRSSNRIRQ